MSLPPELLKKVKLLEINTRKVVNNVFAGEYHTAFKGQGMTFADFREYVPGDDVRTISWHLTARTGKTFVKTFEEERELTLILAVDVSGSSDFGSGIYFKGEVMAHMAAVLAYSAVKNKDQIGLLLFSDQVELYIPPKKGRGHVHRLMRELYFYKPKSHKTDLKTAFMFLQGILKKRASIFVMSDFVSDTYEQSLRLLGKKHEVVACVVRDPLETGLQGIGLVDLQDPETGEVVTVDTNSPSFLSAWKTESLRRKGERDRQLRQAQVERIEVNSSDDFISPLVQFFRNRRK